MAIEMRAGIPDNGIENAFEIENNILKSHMNMFICKCRDKSSKFA